MDELNITGPADDALAAIAQVRAAIESLKGKTVTIIVDPPGEPADSRR